MFARACHHLGTSVYERSNKIFWHTELCLCALMAKDRQYKLVTSLQQHHICTAFFAFIFLFVRNTSTAFSATPCKSFRSHFFTLHCRFIQQADWHVHAATSLESGFCPARAHLSYSRAITLRCQATRTLLLLRLKFIVLWTLWSFHTAPQSSEFLANPPSAYVSRRQTWQRVQCWQRAEIWDGTVVKHHDATMYTQVQITSDHPRFKPKLY